MRGNQKSQLCRRRFRKRHGESGAVMAEFVIILPLLVILLFGIIQFGIAFNRVQALHAAAREGARLASLSQTTDVQIQNRVTQSLNGITFNSAPATAITPAFAKPCNNRGGQTVEVLVTAQYNLSIPFLPPQTLNLTGDGTFRCEG